MSDDYKTATGLRRVAGKIDDLREMLVWMLVAVMLVAITMGAVVSRSIDNLADAVRATTQPTEDRR